MGFLVDTIGIDGLTVFAVIGMASLAIAAISIGLGLWLVNTAPICDEDERL